MQVVVPVYVLIWVLGIFLSGGYDRPLRIGNGVRGVLSGTVFILVVYALLSEEYRFSRALILLGTAWASLSVAAGRVMLDLSGLKGYRLEKSEKKNLVIVAGPDEGKRVLSILQLSGSPGSFVGFVSVDEQNQTGGENNYILGNINNLKEITELYAVNEIIFCAKDISSQEIISKMLLLSKLDVEYKIAPPESLFIIGSNSIDDQGDLYLIDVNAITTRANKRNKRLFDIFTSFACILLSPILIFKVKNFGGFLKNISRVIIGSKTWVGFIQTSATASANTIRKGVLNPADGLQIEIPDEQVANRLNALYARDYNVDKDFRIILRSLSSLGR